MYLKFMELKLQNATINPQNVTIVFLKHHYSLLKTIL